MYRDVSYYITSPASESDLHAAFDCGFLTAMKIFRHAVPMIGNAAEVSRWIAQKATLYELETSAQARQNAHKLLDSAQYDVNEMRAMLFDVAQVNSFGMEVDEKGAIHDEDGELLEGATHREWPLYCYCDREGRQVAGAEADPDTMKAKGYRRVRYFDIYDRESGTEIYQVTSDDETMVQELLRRDIAANYQIAAAYLREAETGGLLEDYANVIREAVKKIPAHIIGSEAAKRNDCGSADAKDRQEEWRKDVADIDNLLTIWITYHLKIDHDVRAASRYKAILDCQGVRKPANSAWRSALKVDLEWLWIMTRLLISTNNVWLSKDDAATIDRIYTRLRTHIKEDGLQ